MKYRILETVTNGGTPGYEPQYRRMLMWFTFRKYFPPVCPGSSGGERYVSCKTAKEAQQIIDDDIAEKKRDFSCKKFSKRVISTTEFKP